MVDNNNGKTRHVLIKVRIRNVRNVDTQAQNFYADIWVGGYDCFDPSEFTNDNARSIAAKAFQEAYEDTENFEIHFPSKNRRPPWTITLLNAENITDMYKENKQPNWRYFPEQNTFYQRMQTRGTFTNNFDIANYPFGMNHRIKSSLCIFFLILTLKQIRKN